MLLQLELGCGKEPKVDGDDECKEENNVIRCNCKGDYCNNGFRLSPWYSGIVIAALTQKLIAMA